ncbi:MAG: cyclase family protein [Desulfovibrionales bacterium]
MNLVDLTLLIRTGMAIYPGDPEVAITQVHTLEREGWNLHKLSLSTHTGTHVNVPAHMVAQGARVDQLGLDRFCGSARLLRATGPLPPAQGYFFEAPLPALNPQDLAARGVTFVGFSLSVDLDLDLERSLLDMGIVVYENLINFGLLPSDRNFLFFGFPLLLTGGDGSPVRAVAEITSMSPPTGPGEGHAP